MLSLLKSDTLAKKYTYPDTETNKSEIIMVPISREDILKLGRSASLHLTEEEIPLLIKNLQTVLSYAEDLKHIAAAHAGLEMPKNSDVMRNDQVIPTPSEPLLAQAPQREDNYFVVPVIIKQ